MVGNGLGGMAPWEAWRLPCWRCVGSVSWHCLPLARREYATLSLRAPGGG